MSISLIELMNYIKKHIAAAVVCMMIGAFLGQAYFGYAQRYYASTTVKYIFENADKGVNPKGESLDAYEMVSPTVIEKVINSLNLNVGVEQIRSAIVITPFIDETTKKKQEAMIKEGEDFEFFPTEYTVTFTYDTKNGADYGVKVLNKLFEAYDEYVRETYTNAKKIPDVFTGIDYSKYDYIEICDLYDEQIDSILDMLDGYQSSNFRSAKTGLSFNDLKLYFSNLKETEYAKLYSTVRAGCLSKNKEILLKNFNYKVEKLQLQSSKKTQESKLSYGILVDFYKKYKQGVSSVDAGKSSADSEGKVIYQQKFPNITSTYDEIVTNYVKSGKEASDAEKDIEYYKKLIEDFSNDKISAEQKQEYLKQAESLIKKLDQQVRGYIALANETLNDYNVYKGTEYISYLSSVSAEAKLSRRMIVAFGAMAGLSFGLMLAVGIEVVRRLREEAELSNKRKKIQLLEKGIMPKDIENMPPLDRALFEAIADEFKEFYLLYQPISDNAGKWIGMEALVRWRSRDFGMILPKDFIQIAEKYDIMEILGKWILHQACRTCKEWNQKFSEDFFVSVNFTLNQIGSKIFMDEILSTLNETKLNPKNLILEISNGHEVENEDVILQKLSAIKTFGAGIALDNFENDLSSLDVLYKLPIEMVKIDMSYLKQEEKDDEKEEFVKSIVKIADTVGFRVCAENVENEEMVSALWERGVLCMQGYYISQPLSCEQVEKHYSENKY
ncbi:MAG: EAL domain-containing protein [Clostridia bacterium]|nr:EAL domain-containing protein [Clostridia bacterium]